MPTNNPSLGQKAISSTIWVFAERILLELFRFVTTIILARILGPKDFGLVALTSIITSVSMVFIDSGFTKALIQKKETTKADESTIFFFNILICSVFVIIINLIAGSVADYYHEPLLKNILRAVSLTLILVSFRQIQQVILSKSFNFKLQFKANVLGSIISGITGILLALNGWGVWSLVVQTIVDAASKSILFWTFSKWRPSWVFSKASFLELYKYGINLFFNDLLKVVTENMYGFLIGKKYNPYELGLYDRGNKLASLVITNFQYSIQKVTFPLFSKVQDDIAALRNVVKKSLDLIMFLVTPSMIMLIVIAKPLILVLLTEKWIDIVSYVQLFCIYWIFFPFSGVNNHLVLALGHSRTIFKQSLLIYGLQIIVLLITMQFGIRSIIIGQIFSTIVRQLILIYYAEKLVQFGFKEQGLIFFRHVIRATVAIVPTYLLMYVVTNNYLLISLQLITGMGLYFGLAYILSSPSMMLLMKNLVKVLKIKKIV